MTSSIDGLAHRASQGLTKASLRQRASDIRAEVYDPEAGKALLPHLLGLPALADARNVVGFASRGTEIDLYPSLRLLNRIGKRLFLPRMEQGRRLSFHAFEPGDPLLVNRWGIAEPSARTSLWVPEAGDLVLCPGLAFDDQGGRLGYGAGFYDRALNSIEVPILRIGVGFEAQWSLGNLPQEEHDLRLDGFLHEAGAGIWELA